MLLAIDIGNTDITIGLHTGNEWIHRWRVPSLPDRPELFYGLKISENFLEAGLKAEQVEEIIMSSVVPGLTETVTRVMMNLFGREPLLLGPEVYTRLPIKVMNPYEIGSDLVANALAAYTRFKTNCIVVDFGTALTFTIISASGEIVGVTIAPGLRTALRALSQNTAKLYDVPLEMPTSVLGKGTVHAIQAGVLVGYEGMVKHMVERIREELGDPQAAVVATGGLSAIVSSLSGVYTAVDPDLTLNGLRMLHEYR